MKKMIIPLLLVCGLAVADAPNEPVNYCGDREQWVKIDALLQQNPDDQLVIRSYATRLGICRLIEEKKISLETGIRVFEIERQRAIMERIQEEAGRKRQKAIPAEDVEPMG